MTKQEQIEEMTKLINSKEIYPCEDDVHCENCFCSHKDTAEKLFNAGYRKVDEIKRLEKENKQLKTECALLDDELRIARQDTIDVLNKVKEKLNNTPNGWAYTTYIDELIKGV